MLEWLPKDENGKGLEWQGMGYGADKGENNDRDRTFMANDDNWL